MIETDCHRRITDEAVGLKPTLRRYGAWRVRASDDNAWIVVFAVGRIWTPPCCQALLIQGEIASVYPACERSLWLLAMMEHSRVQVPQRNHGLRGRHPTQALPALIFPRIAIGDWQTR